MPPSGCSAVNTANTRKRFHMSGIVSVVISLVCLFGLLFDVPTGINVKSASTSE